MPRPRPQSASRPSQASRPAATSRSHTQSEGLTEEEMAALAGFDLVENALDEFQPPELASRREVKAAKVAARSAAVRAERAGAQAPGATPQPHYFSSAPPLVAGQGKIVQVQVAGASLALRGGAGTFSKSELDEGTQILIETFVASEAFGRDAEGGAPLWCDLGCGWGAVSCALATLRPDARLLACDINRRAAALALGNARSLSLAGVAAWNGDGLGACRDGVFDAVLCNPPVRAGNRVIEGLFQDAQRGLKVGGELWIVLRTAQGAKSWQKKLAAQFGSCDTMQISHGYRILRSTKGDEAAPRS